MSARPCPLSSTTHSSVLHRRADTWQVADHGPSGPARSFSHQPDTPACSGVSKEHLLHPEEEAVASTHPSPIRWLPGERLEDSRPRQMGEGLPALLENRARVPPSHARPSAGPCEAEMSKVRPLHTGSRASRPESHRSGYSP